MRREELKHHAPVLLRVFLAGVLVYGTQDNVFSAERMREFEAFLAERGTPFPRLAAPVSVYAQFGAGLLLFAGFQTRPAAALMVFHFFAALAIAHRDAPFAANIAPLAMLTLSLFFVMHGSGPWSLDERRRYRQPTNAS